MTTAKIVTKEWLMAKIAENPVNTIGRALVAIFRHQTEVEKSSNTVTFRNGIGFTQADARTGSISAKYFLKHGTLEEWQLKIWNGLNKKGQPRIVKYAGQLNNIANAKTKEIYQSRSY